jgi:hypothetical protein
MDKVVNILKLISLGKYQTKLYHKGQPA